MSGDQVEESSGCVFFDLNIPCRREGLCALCSTPKLLPCPFCGVRAYLMPQDCVECGGCGVVMEGLDAEDAVGHWNARSRTTRAALLEYLLFASVILMALSLAASAIEAGTATTTEIGVVHESAASEAGDAQ